MMMMLLTDVNTKVFCSACSAMFRSTGTQQVVDSKGFFTTFSMFVPLFHNIYKGRRIAKYFTMLSGSGRLDRQSFVQTHFQRGTLEQADNEAHNTMISLHFLPFHPTGTQWNRRNNA
jgi:hypothetical protein